MLGGRRGEHESRFRLRVRSSIRDVTLELRDLLPSQLGRYVQLGPIRTES